MLLMLLHTSMAQAFTQRMPVEASQAAYGQAGSALSGGHLPRARDREGALAAGLSAGQHCLRPAAGSLRRCQLPM